MGGSPRCRITPRRGPMQGAAESDRVSDLATRSWRPSVSP